MVIELEDVGAWPAGALEFVDDWMQSGKSLDDIDRAGEAEFRAMFESIRVRAYHCSRYLEQELATLGTNGLVVASKSFFDERIRRAASTGAITDSFRDELLLRHAFANGDDGPEVVGRVGKTCFAVPRAYLNSRTAAALHGMGGFLMWWGGEAVFTICDDSEKEFLRVGRPTIVVCSFDVTKWLQQRLPVQLLRVCIQIRRGVPDAASQIDWTEAIAPEAIEAMWHPGDREYDTHDKLPRG